MVFRLMLHQNAETYLVSFIVRIQSCPSFDDLFETPAKQILSFTGSRFSGSTLVSLFRASLTCTSKDTISPCASIDLLPVLCFFIISNEYAFKFKRSEERR